MSRHRCLAIAALFISCVTAGYFLTFWNRFLGPNVSGMFPEFATRWSQGAFPYRDFFMVVPPFFMFKTRAIMHIFGPDLYVQRIIDVATRCLLAVVVFIQLARVVRIPHALLGSIAAIVLFCADPADPLAMYHQESVFWAVLAGCLLSYAKWRTWRNDFLPVLGAGVCCSISLLTKQTTGAGITFALAIVICVLGAWSGGVRGAAQRLMVYALGWAIPAGAVTIWLARQGAFGAFFDDVFLKGPSSKGPVAAILFRVITQPLGAWVGRLELVLSLLAAILAMLFLRRVKTYSAECEPIEIMWLITLCTTALLAGFAFSFAGMRLPLSGRFGAVESFAIRVAFWSVAAFASYYTILALRRKPDQQEAQRWILTMVSFSTAYMLSLSWAAYGPMACPSVAVLVAFVLEEFSILKRSRAAWYVVVASLAGLLIIAEYAKMETPFGWIGWTDPPTRTAVAQSTLPQLSRIYMSPAVRDFTDTLTSLIVRNSRPGESVFIFPYEPLFYVLSDRQPPTFALVHWFDVAPDALCRNDAQRLIDAAPPVIVDFSIDPFSFTYNEHVFRQGRPSGQRYLYERMYQLIGERYRLIAQLREPGPDNVKVKVFVRN